MSQIFWRQSAGARHDAPCLFLDRDGVLVREVDYLHRPGDVELLDGAAELIRAARERGFAVGMATNQAGIGRGYYGWDDFSAVQDEVTRRLGGLQFDFVAACGAHPEAVVPEQRVAAHPWRKPAPGMLLAAAAALRLDLGASVFVGDQVTDVQAALAAGVGRTVHVMTGHGRDHREAVLEVMRSSSGVMPASDLRDAAALLGW